jgi:predicted nucleotidyltransferase
MLSKELQDRIITHLLPFQPARIGIFGSYARGEEKESSDLDILVHFLGKISLLELVQIEQNLADDLNIEVDLVTENSLKNPRLIHSIRQDLINIFDHEKRPSLSRSYSR